MRAKMQSTSEVVEIDAVGYAGRTKARVWEGVTDGGVPFTAYIPLVQVRTDADNSQFEHELSEHKAPEPDTLRAIELRHIL